MPNFQDTMAVVLHQRCSTTAIFILYIIQKQCRKENYHKGKEY